MQPILRLHLNFNLKLYSLDYSIGKSLTLQIYDLRNQLTTLGSQQMLIELFL
nr:MAG TPA: hypothetical protein [Caudoviricetes sp.]